MSISPVGSQVLPTQLPTTQPDGQARGLTTAAPPPAAAETSSVAAADKGVAASEAAQDKDSVHQAVETIQKVVETMTRDLQFSIDEELKRTVIKVVDTNTDEVIRQIPAQEVLDIARSLNKLQGLLVRQTA